MTIEQKAREIAEAVSDNWKVERKGLEFAVAKHAARLGIIKGVKMAYKAALEAEQQQDNDHGAANTGGAQQAAKAIRALIEEQKV